MERISSLEHLEYLLNPHYKERHETNCYFLKEGFSELVSSSNLYAIQDPPNLVLLLEKSKGEFFQLYFFLKDFSRPIAMNSEIPIVIELPYRGPKLFPEKVVLYWEMCGFKRHIDRSLYTLALKDVDFQEQSNSNAEFRIVNDLDTAPQITRMARDTFDKYTGDLPTLREVEEGIQADEMLGAYIENKLVGFLRFYTQNKISWIGHIAISDDHRGKGIGKSILQTYLNLQANKAIQRYQQWVVSDNKAAINLYTGLGFKYANKSSISLLK